MSASPAYTIEAADVRKYGVQHAGSKLLNKLCKSARTPLLAALCMRQEVMYLMKRGASAFFKKPLRDPPNRHAAALSRTLNSAEYVGCCCSSSSAATRLAVLAAQPTSGHREAMPAKRGAAAAAESCACAGMWLPCCVAAAGSADPVSAAAGPALACVSR